MYTKLNKQKNLNIMSFIKNQSFFFFFNSILSWAALLASIRWLWISFHRPSTTRSSSAPSVKSYGIDCLFALNNIKLWITTVASTILSTFFGWTQIVFNSTCHRASNTPSIFNNKSTTRQLFVVQKLLFRKVASSIGCHY